MKMLTDTSLSYRRNGEDTWAYHAAVIPNTIANDHELDTTDQNGVVAYIEDLHPAIVINGTTTHPPKGSSHRN